MMKPFSAYIALGDSMSIDLYPALDLNQPADTPLGAAALLYSNQADFWPAFGGRDLRTLYPDIAFLNLSEDGATTWDLLEGSYFKYIGEYIDQSVLVTVTIGGNDALQMLRIEAGQGGKLTAEVASIVDRYQKVLLMLCSTFRCATVILNTIYDPSDGSGVMPGYPGFAEKLPFLGYINDHFFGHGIATEVDDCWYWRINPIEPDALGASELRALWLKTLVSEGLIKVA
jgi:hypothetical protein